MPPSTNAAPASGDAMETDDKPAGSVVDKIREVLTGKVTIGLNLEFLFRNNKTDLLILKTTKVGLVKSASALSEVICIECVGCTKLNVPRCHFVCKWNNKCGNHVGSVFA